VTARCDARSTRAVYAIGAGAYDEAWSPVIRPPALEVIRRLRLRGATYVLDIGAGTGALTPALRDAAPDATIVSLEPARPMLRYALQHRDVTPVQADACALPVAASRADAVLLAYVLFMLPDPVRGVREATRVLRAGGRAGTVTWASETPSIAAKVWDETLDEHRVPILPAHSEHAGLDTAEGITDLLRAAGLADVEVWCEAIDHTFSPDDFWQLRTGHGVSGVRLARLEPDRRERVLATLRDRLSSLAAEDYRIDGTLVCSVSTKPTEARE
jgi:SAM-dependent methyltransferase